MSYGFQRCGVDVLHVVGKCVPRWSERTLRTVGIVGNDVDGRDVGMLVQGQVVVGDLATLLLGEETAPGPVEQTFSASPSLPVTHPGGLQTLQVDRA